MIDRKSDFIQIRTALRRSRVVALLGPRQSGKTTLARQFVPADSVNYFDLEDSQNLARLTEPNTALRPLKGLVVIDEIQRRPELFPLLRVLVDRKPLPARFLILGSASPELLRQSSETLAGRSGSRPLKRISPDGPRGKCPKPALAPRRIPFGLHGQERYRFRGLAPSVPSDFLERDIPQLGIEIPAASLRRFWNMLAHYHAQTWNGAELARALAVSESTVRRYLDILTGVFMLRQLPPWFENLSKRQIKAPKVYVRDSGLLHALLGIGNQRELELHPKVGASWEGFAVEEVLKAQRPDDAYFWATHQGAELDLLLFKHGRRVGLECKRMDAPTLTPSMRIALSDLNLDRLIVVYPGDRRYRMAERVEAVPLAELIGAGQDPAQMFMKRRDERVKKNKTSAEYETADFDAVLTKDDGSPPELDERRGRRRRRRNAES